MSSGDDHDKVNSYVTTAIVGLGVSTQDPLVLFAASGCFVGTWWLSPDLDLPHSNPSNRLGFLNGLFAPYRRLCRRHRSPISHSPVFSSLFRVAYCLFPIFIYAVAVDQFDAFVKLLLDKRFLAVLVGLEISSIVHLVMDWQYSLKRKLLK